MKDYSFLPVQSRRRCDDGDRARRLGDQGTRPAGKLLT